MSDPASSAALGAAAKRGAADRAVIDLGSERERNPDAQRVGARGERFHRLRRAGLAVPDGFILTCEAVDGWNAGGAQRDAVAEAIANALARLEARTGMRLGGCPPLLLAVRQSAADIRMGLHPSVLDVGATEAAILELAATFGAAEAARIRCQFLQGFACTVLGAFADPFEVEREATEHSGAAGYVNLAERFAGIVARDCGESIPDDGHAQLHAAIDRLARPRAGFAVPCAEHGRALIVQAMAQGGAPGRSGHCSVRLRDPSDASLAPVLRFTPNARTGEAQGIADRGAMLTDAERAAFLDAAGRAEEELREALELGFVVESGELRLIDAAPQRLETEAEAALALSLAERNLISRPEATLRIDPVRLEGMLHARVEAGAAAAICRGVAAAPGAATGTLVFSAGAAEQLAARGGDPILVRSETEPGDVGAMHVAKAVLTSRGGMTSHAAVVARGLGRPCVAGINGITIDAAARRMRVYGTGVLLEGAQVTVDGARGRVYAGFLELLPPTFGGAMAVLLEWADEFRRMGVRANADTVRDAELALRFRADGVGLCRTEHMFFAKGRINAMREVILAESESERRRALERLRPMQHGDFRDLFATMRGRPVVVRLLDPPLHEFLPHGEREMLELAQAMRVPVDRVMARAAALEEFNPMLGNRGCRVGVAYPEIYEMQARAIFEAAVEAGRETGEPAVPEIMVPLVSAQREMEILKRRIDAVAAAVESESGEAINYRVGAMIETPRAALRAHAITDSSQFLSFGTNDLTQMAYGLSRDDAGRFMPDYLRKGVYPSDPFETLDLEGVGELISLAVDRARSRSGEVVLGLCGEHGADPASLEFCESIGVDYVSCSPFRLPVARLAAAHATIRSRMAAGSADDDGCSR